MGAVDVCVGHDDDAVVAQLVGVEVLPTDAGAERRDQRTDLGGRQHLVEARFLDVQDLALERQDRLGAPIPALLRRAAGGVTLDQEELGQAGSFSWQSASLPGSAGDIQSAFAPGHLARLARRFAGPGGLDNLRDDDLGFLRIFDQEVIQRPPIA